MRYIFILFISLSVYSQNDSKQLLFIGNSLTYTNNLPGILKNIAAAFNETIETTSLCYPNYGLEDHWNDGKIQKLINKGEFDYIIIQQGPSSQNEGKQMLIDYGSKIKRLTDKNGSQLVYFMVWPSKNYYYTFNGVIANHKLAAEINDALLFPVGEIWKSYDETKSEESLYSIDGFHPSKTGSFLSALTMFKTIYPNKDLNTLSFENSKTWVTNNDSFNTIIKLINTKTKEYGN